MFLTRLLSSGAKVSRRNHSANRFRLNLESLDARDLPSVAFFLANDGVHGMELWRTDGTPAGTAMVKDINPGGNDAGVRSMIDFNGTLYFVANDGVHGQELWTSDGTEAGTVLVKDIYPGSGIGLDWYSHDASNALVIYNGAICFRANDGTNGAELWKSDGTRPGTVMVKDIDKGSSSGGAYEITLMYGKPLFKARTNKNGFELWRSDGTAAGTVMVKDIVKGSNAGHAHGLIAVGTTLYFTASDTKNGFELWKSNGTAAGTVMVKDINPNGDSIFNLEAHVAVGNILYFQANDGVHGEELWKTDGTAAGTVMIADVNPGSDSSEVQALTAFNGKVYFTARDSSFTFKLWVSDGTAAGTSVFLDVPFNYYDLDTHYTVFDGRLYISDPLAGVWSTDGTSVGTVENPDQFLPLTAFNGQVPCSRYDPDHGTELWIGDGTSGGTSLLADIWAGPTSSNISNFIVVG